MRNRVAFLGARELERKVADENGIVENIEAELLFLGLDGSYISAVVPVLAKSERFIVTSEGVIKLTKESPFGTEQDENFLSFQEFLETVEKKCDG